MNNLIFFAFYGTIAVFYLVLQESIESGFSRITKYFNWPALPICFGLILGYVVFVADLIEIDIKLISWPLVSLITALLFFYINKSQKKAYSELRNFSNDNDDSSSKNDKERLKILINRDANRIKFLSYFALGLMVIGIAELFLVDSYIQFFYDSLGVDNKYIEEEMMLSGNHTTGREIDSVIIETYVSDNASLDFFANSILSFIIKVVYIIPYFIILLASGSQSEKN
jgi:hypothetical protein